MRVSFAAIVILFSSSGVIDAQPTSAPVDRGIPQNDPKIEPLVRALLASKTTHEYFAVREKIFVAQSNKEFTDEAWMTQVLVNLSQLDRQDAGMQAWISEVGLMQVSLEDLKIGPEKLLEVYVPYVNDSDPNVAHMAFDILDNSSVFGISTIGNSIDASPSFEAIDDYFQAQPQAELPTKIIENMYYHPDAALTTFANVYLKGEMAQQVARNQTEMKILFLSHIFADKQAKSEIEKKAVAQLNDLSLHSHWCVRAYALAVARDASWVDPMPMAMRLLNDPNSVVSAMAKGIVESHKTQ